MSSRIFDWDCLEQLSRKQTFILGGKPINLQSNKNRILRNTRNPHQREMHSLGASSLFAKNFSHPLARCMPRFWGGWVRLFAHIMFWINLNNNRTSVNFLLVFPAGNSNLGVTVSIAIPSQHMQFDCSYTSVCGTSEQASGRPGKPPETNLIIAPNLHLKQFCLGLEICSAEKCMVQSVPFWQPPVSSWINMTVESNGVLACRRVGWWQWRRYALWWRWESCKINANELARIVQMELGFEDIKKIKLLWI